MSREIFASLSQSSGVYCVRLDSQFKISVIKNERTFLYSDFVFVCNGIDMVSKHSELLTLKPFSRFCDGYSQCDTKTKEKITTTCEKNQVCFFREDIAISAFNVTYDPLLLLSVSSTYAMTHALMSKNKQIVQVAHMETAGCINKNSTLSDKKLHADCEVDLKAELYDIKVKLTMRKY